MVKSDNGKKKRNLKDLKGNTLGDESRHWPKTNKQTNKNKQTKKKTHCEVLHVFE